MAAVERELNIAGHQYLHPCPFCLQDFGGRVLLGRHRISRTERYHSREERCLTPDEMMERGWYLDRFGRWRDKRPVGVRT